MRTRHPGEAAQTCRRYAKSRARGSVILWFLVSLVLILGIGAFAVDMMRIITVKRELQNAADAAAISGAAHLAQQTTNGPDWTAAIAQAASDVSLNYSDGVKLANGSAQAGYWDVASAHPTLVPYTTPPTQAATATYMPEPAVQVTVSRNGSANSLVNLILGGFLGVKTVSESATAVALLTPATSVPAGNLFPMAIDQCVYNSYWNSTTNSPKLGSNNQPYPAGIGESAPTTCTGTAAQWTSFLADNSETDVSNSLTTGTYGNPTPLTIGQDIYMVTGAKAALYGTTNTVYSGQTVLIPVVNGVASGTKAPIVAFATFYISSANQGGKTISGYFVSGGNNVAGSGGLSLVPPTGSGISTTPADNYGAYYAPRLAD